MEYFGLKLDQDLGNRAAHPHQKFRGVPQPPPLGHINNIIAFLVAMISVDRVLSTLMSVFIKNVQLMAENSIHQSKRKTNAGNKTRFDKSIGIRVGGTSMSRLHHPTL